MATTSKTHAETLTDTMGDTMGNTMGDTMGDTMGERVDAIVAAGRDAAGELKDKALAAKDAVVDTSGTLAHSLSKAIKRRPLTSVLVAFGIGYIAMRFVRLPN